MGDFCSGAYMQSWESLGSGRAAVEPPYYRTPTLIGVKTGTSFVRGGKSESLKTLAGRRLMPYQSSCRIAAPKDRSMANWFESRAETMTETEAEAYFTESNYPHPGPGEAWGEALKRAYLADVNRAAEMIPRL